MNNVVDFEKDKTKIAASLLAARKKAHLSQERVAELIGRSRSTVSRQERGKFKDISLGELYDYAKCYDVPPSTLLPGFTRYYELRGSDISDFIKRMRYLLNALEAVAHPTLDKK